MPYCYKYPRPALTVDALVASDDGMVLLIQRKNPPFEGLWALPGGFVDIDEAPEEAVLRELKEETGLENIKLEQFHTYGAIGRDPRHRTVSIVFIGKVSNANEFQPVGNDDAADSKWFPWEDLPDLAFDHKKIVEDVLIILNLSQ